MNTEPLSRAILRSLRSVLLVDLAVVMLVALIGWLAGWRSPSNFANGLVIAGFALAAIAAYSMIGGWRITRDFTYRYGQSVGDSPQESFKLDQQEESTLSISFAVLLLLSSILPCVIATYIEMTWR